MNPILIVSRGRTGRVLRQNALVVVLAWLFMLAAGCGESPTQPTAMVDSGSWYETGFRWPHDGHPYESEHFVVFSDAASDQARQSLAEIGEEVLADLIGQVGTTDRELFVFPVGRQKIHMFAYRNHFPMEWGGKAYYGGILIYSLDHPERGLAGHTALNMYVPVVRHELMHVMESLIKASGNPRLVDVWLTEGIAEHISGGTAGGSVTDLAKLNELTAAFGRVNPIAMHRYEDYPDQANIGYEYLYPMFQLAAEYLMDEEGRGATLRDLRDLYFDIRDGVLFPVAFANRFGISVADFEAQFFDLVTDYLSKPK